MTEWGEELDAEFEQPSVMSAEEEKLATRVYEAIQFTSSTSERSRQQSNFQIGISDIGFCHERTRRMVSEIPPADGRDVLEAFLGTAIGDHTEKAMAQLYNTVAVNQRVAVKLQGDNGTYLVYGHPDWVEPWIVVDVKTVNGLEVVKRTGPSKQQLFQRHCYALGAWEAGMFDVPLEDVKTANLWIDRSGRTKNFHVHMDTFDMNIVAEATVWLDDVIYAVLNNEVAQKDPPRVMCAKVCGHFATCRQGEVDEGGLITDPEILAAVDLYAEGLKLAKIGNTMKTEANSALQGITGSTGNWNVGWTHVNGSSVNYDRKPYDRLNISKAKPPKL